jgi:hypothetical protein
MTVHAEILQRAMSGGGGNLRDLYARPSSPLQNPPRRIRRRPASWLDLGKTVASLQDRRRSDRGKG